MKKIITAVSFLVWAAAWFSGCTHQAQPPEPVVPSTKYISNYDFDRIFRGKIPEVSGFNINDSQALEYLEMDPSGLSNDRQVEMVFLKLLQEADKEKDIADLLKMKWEKETDNEKSLFKNFIRSYPDYTDRDIQKNPAYLDSLFLLAYLADNAIVDKASISKKIVVLTEKKKAHLDLKGYALQFYLFSKVKKNDFHQLGKWLKQLQSLTTEQVFIEDLKYIKEQAQSRNQLPIVSPQICRFYHDGLSEEFEKTSGLAGFCTPLVTNSEFDRTFRSDIPEILSFNFMNDKALKLMENDSSRLSEDRRLLMGLFRLVQKAKKKTEIPDLLKQKWEQESKKEKSAFIEFIKNYHEYTERDFIKKPAYRDCIYLLAFLADDKLVKQGEIQNKVKELSSGRDLKGYSLQFYLYSKIANQDWGDLGKWLKQLQILTTEQVFIEDLKYIKEQAQNRNQLPKVRPQICRFYHAGLSEEFEKTELADLCAPLITNSEFDRTFRSDIPEILSFNFMNDKALKLMENDSSRLSEDRRLLMGLFRLVQKAGKKTEIQYLLKQKWEEESKKEKSAFIEFIKNYNEYTERDFIKKPAYHDCLYLLAFLADDNLVKQGEIQNKVKELGSGRDLKGYALQFYLYSKIANQDWGDLGKWLKQLQSLTSKQIFIENLKFLKRHIRKPDHQINEILCRYKDEFPKLFNDSPELAGFCRPFITNEDFDQTFRDRIPEAFGYNFTDKKVMEKLEYDPYKLTADRKLLMEFFRLIQKAGNNQDIPYLLDLKWKEESKEKSAFADFIKKFWGSEFSDKDFMGGHADRDCLYMLAYIADNNLVVQEEIQKNIQELDSGTRIKGYPLHFFLYSKINRLDWNGLEPLLERLKSYTDIPIFIEDLRYLKKISKSDKYGGEVDLLLCKYKDEFPDEFMKIPEFADINLPKLFNIKVEFKDADGQLHIDNPSGYATEEGVRIAGEILAEIKAALPGRLTGIINEGSHKNSQSVDDFIFAIKAIALEPADAYKKVADIRLRIELSDFFLEKHKRDGKKVRYHLKSSQLDQLAAAVNKRLRSVSYYLSADSQLNLFIEYYLKPFPEEIKAFETKNAFFSGNKVRKIATPIQGAD